MEDAFQASGYTSGVETVRLILVLAVVRGGVSSPPAVFLVDIFVSRLVAPTPMMPDLRGVLMDSRWLSQMQ